MKTLTIICCFALLVFNSTNAIAEGQKHRALGKNVALGKTVQARGQFFIGGFGNPRVVDYSTLVDGLFFPEGRIFNQGPIWWDENVDGIQNFLEVYLGNVFKVRWIVIQVDNNDDYLVSWNDVKSGPQQIVIVPPDVIGMAPPVTVKINAITDSFRIENNVSGFGDGFYAVSEIQAFGRKYKE